MVVIGNVVDVVVLQRHQEVDHGPRRNLEMLQQVALLEDAESDASQSAFFDDQRGHFQDVEAPVVDGADHHLELTRMFAIDAQRRDAVLC